MPLPDWRPVALEIVELAAAAGSLPAFMDDMMGALQQRLGFDSAALSPLAASWMVTWNKPAEYGELWQRRRAIYMEEVSDLVRAALGSVGVVHDAEVLPARVRERAAFYDEYIRPHGGGTFACVGLAVPGAPFGLALARHGRGRFRQVELDWLRQLRPALALAVRGVAQSSPVPPPLASPVLEALTAREREFSQYVARGLTNVEIAGLCGCSQNTVRNRLAGVFRKLDVTTRAELAGLIASHEGA